MYRYAATALAVLAGVVSVAEAQQAAASVAGTVWVDPDPKHHNKSVSFRADNTYTITVRYPNETKTYQGNHTWLQTADSVEMTIRDDKMQVYSVGQIKGDVMTVTGTTSYTAGGRASTRFQYTLHKQ